jgi:hypothetical protein
MELIESTEGQSQLVRFFVQRGIGPCGLTHAEIIDLSDDQLEAGHHFIQWLFPLNEPSRHIDNAPLITANDLNLLKGPFPKAHFLSGVLRFLNFYGMDYLTPKQVFTVQPAATFTERAANWATPGNHNLKRITRIIRSCRFFGADQVARAVHQGFCDLQPQLSGVITKTVKGFWDDALNVPLDQPINVSPNIRRVRP